VGILCLFSPKKLSQVLALAGSIAAFALTILVFLILGKNPSPLTAHYLLLDNLSRFVLLAIGLFGVVITLYSLKFMNGEKRLREYYCYILWTLGAAIGAVLANNLILLLVFWGFLGLTLYLLIGMGGAKAADISKKTFIIVGGTDCLMMLGIGLIWVLTGTFNMSEISEMKLATGASGFATIAFLCMAAASFAKAGAMPLHTWIPDCAKDAPASVSAFLPASLDKLLGIYLLARICMNLFSPSPGINLFLLVIGAITIVAAVMMALIQHDFKKLLGYHAVSQVGYMILGIGTGNPIGIAGGLFHMLNHAIYKSCLFLCGGGVEKKAGTTDLDKLGGLGRLMPVTFVTCLISALAISGVPPLNGFVSKWMVYQGVVELGKGGGKLWIVWLAAAMFGSALTLASFMKLIHAAFLGVKAPGLKIKGKLQEVHWTMWLPMAVLAGLCLIFGIFAFQIPLKYFILPSVYQQSVVGHELFSGFWQPGLATLLMVIGLIIGGIIYLLCKSGKVREDNLPYVGGEILPEESRVTGVDFYRTIEDIGFFKFFYRKAEEKWFDIYEVKKKLIFFFTGKLQKLHSGILPVYLIWCLIGMAIIFIVSSGK
jgi:formate hydrogenlyase subunit 3/multisubunit Na+/H+ antiporter MnhD subunit